MTTYGFHCSHEEIGPRAMLDWAKKAEQAGFTAAMCSDHLAPWSERQGESGFAWSWLGAALESTDMSFGVVNAPGQRYHPVIIAQAIATLAQMYPGRFWTALGSGEAMNEHVTGERWPSKPERNERLLECVTIIRALLRGEEVSHRGHVTVDRARVWSLPEVQPLLIGTAVTHQTSGWVASWADGMATIAQPEDKLKQVIGAYRDNGGNGEVTVQTHLSVARTRDEALAEAYDQWASNIFNPPVCWDLETPEAFDEISRYVTPEDVAKSVFVTSESGPLLEHIAMLERCGADRVYLHNVGTEHGYFLEMMANDVFPNLNVEVRS
jgi:probable non-F420 flavinoid oxidoreductase